jgi:hypothetical protein
MIIRPYNKHNANRSITIGYKQRNTDTDLIFFGTDSINYGEGILSNFVHLLENFANDMPPKGIIGQFYYNKSDQMLYFYNNEQHWIAIENKPNKATLDVVHFTKASDHSSRLLNKDLIRYMQTTGNTNPASISLFDNNATIDNQAVTKGYVDATLVKDSNEYLPRDGVAVMSGPLLLPNVLSGDQPNTLVNNKYVDRLGVVELVKSQEYIDGDKTKIINTACYKVTGVADDDGNISKLPWFVHVTFNTTIKINETSVSLTLPFAFKESKAKQNGYSFTMAVTATAVDSYEPLRVAVSSGTTFTVYRNTKAADLKIHGSIMGYVEQNVLGSSL